MSEAKGKTLARCFNYYNSLRSAFTFIETNKKIATQIYRKKRFKAIIVNQSFFPSINRIPFYFLTFTFDFVLMICFSEFSRVEIKWNEYLIQK